jgi:predicted N-acetyltransferase YhbS
MEVIEYGALTDEQRAQLEGSEEDPFDSAGWTLKFRSKERHVGLVADDGNLVASTGMVLVEVEVGEQRFPVVGLGGVIVNRGYRRQGLAREVVGAALSRASDFGPRLAALFCLPDRAGLYRKLGFSPVDGVVQVEQPGGFESMPLQMMWRALHPGAHWPGGRVRLHSLPF